MFDCNYPISKKYIMSGLKTCISQRDDLEGCFSFILEKSEGPYVWDLDNNKYIDFSSSTGAIILGYNNKEVNQSVIDEINKGNTLLPTTASKIQVELAKKILELHTNFDRVLFYKTGSCATTAAVRLARLYTQKEIILTSGYHGWHDWHQSIFPKYRLPVNNFIEFHYNLNLLKQEMEKNKHNLAGVIITPDPSFFPSEYYKEIEKICHHYSTILIFDEIMCGLRINQSGFYSTVDVKPDLVTIAKGLANGFSISAIIGKEEIMKKREITHLVGTFHNEQTSMVAALTTLNIIKSRNVIDHLHKIGTLLFDGLNKLFLKFGVQARAYGIPTCFHIIFEDLNFENIFYKNLLSHGILLHPFDPQMVTYAHQEYHINVTLNTISDCLSKLKLIHGYQKYFSHNNYFDISKSAIEFRALHELGGTPNYLDDISNINAFWDQKDR